ncbi:MAG: aryl-sulfate sulfotransferase [Planctomycetota bacterium]|jgi:hypothetical protein
MRLFAGLSLLLACAACGSGAPPLSIAAARAAFVIESPRNGAIINRQHPTVTWSEMRGATFYEVVVSRDAGGQDVVERGIAGVERRYQLQGLLGDKTEYHVSVTARASYGGAIAFAPVTRCRTLLVPDWMPEFDLVTNDRGARAGGYRMTELLHVIRPDAEVSIGAALLFNEEGEIVWWFRWPEESFLALARPTEDGTILLLVRLTGSEYDAYEIDWDGRVVWEAPKADQIHHDIGPGPDGLRMYMTYVFEEYDGTLFEGDGIEIVDPATNAPIWSWNIFDHFRPEDFSDIPELAQPGLSGVGAQDWSHGNAIVWDEARSLIWMSVRNFDRLIGIDYPSGDVAITLGMGGIGGEGFMSHQHAPEIQPDGSILLWDNGNTRVPPYSRAIQYSFDETLGTYDTLFEWADTPTFFDFAVGDANRLANGNTLMTAGTSQRIVEVDPVGRIVWDLRMREGYGFWHYRCHAVPDDWIPASIRALGD